MLSTILLVFAFVLMFLAGLNVGHPRVSLGWLGAALAVLSVLLGGVVAWHVH